MSTKCIIRSPQTSSKAEQWQYFVREMVERAEAHLSASQFTDGPEQIYLSAREEIYTAYQERLECTRRQCDPATIIKTSVITTHSYLSKQSSCGVLYTLGYGMLGASIIIEQLVELGVAIYDIRFSPRSRSPKWRKPFLSKWLGDNYLHLPALGNVNYNQPGWDIELADPATGVPLVAKPLRQGKHIALMCVCQEHEACHRSDAANEILKQTPEAILLPFPALERYHS